MADDDKGPAQEPEKVNDSWMWIRDSKGMGSVTTTFAAVAFYVTTFAYIMSVVESIGPVALRSFDVAACSSYMVPILALYFGRRWTEAKLASENEPKGGA